MMSTNKNRETLLPVSRLTRNRHRRQAVNSSLYQRSGFSWPGEEARVNA